MNISKYNTDDFNATFSPEDNKLRLYASVRIDQEDWQEMKENGWKWAPKQELFFCFWSVNNEDFCLALAGDIMPEEITMVERAEMKADRLLILAQKRSDQCVGYQLAANNLMDRINSNQPILIGHHSQRKAEKAVAKIDRTKELAEEKAEAVGYWVWRAKGVICHADHKNNTRTIANRIKTLLTDMRKAQSYINEAGKSLIMLTKISNNTNIEIKNKQIEYFSGSGYKFSYDCYDELREGKITHDQALARMFATCEKIINSTKRARIINHLLNRLAYEQGQLSIVQKFEGDITPAVIQTFLRTHGAEKPKATKNGDSWIAVSSVCFPLHIAASDELELSDQEWRDLMQSVGYEVPEKTNVKSGKATLPILNFKTEKPFMWNRFQTPRPIRQIELTKEQYKRVGKDHTCTGLSVCQTFRYRIGFVKIGVDQWGNSDFEWCAVFITDSKAHPAPESMINSEAA